MRPDALRAGTATKAARAGPEPKTRLSRGETRAHKRMAEIGAVYDATPVPRSVADIRDEGDQRTAGPLASNKWLTASVVKAPAAVIKRIFEEAQRRDPNTAAPGSRWSTAPTTRSNGSKLEAKARGVNVTIILDFVPVLEYLWAAAACFYPEGDPAAERWVQHPATRVLEGHARKVAGAIRRKATNAKLDLARRKPAEAAANYLTNKARYLDYPTALTRGWPIATGIIEGARRHLVKDRLDITGARWGLTDAEAILKLRAIKANGDFDEYWRYHLNQERHHVHESRYLNQAIPQTT